MSMYGDNTPKQCIYEWLLHVRAEHNLTVLDLAKETCEVLAGIIEYHADESQPQP